MAQTPKRILIAGLGRHVAASHEVGPRLGIQKTNRQIVLDVRPTREPFTPENIALILIDPTGDRQSQSCRLRMLKHGREPRAARRIDKSDQEAVDGQTPRSVHHRFWTEGQCCM